jgi:hypothetical protein
MTNTLSATLTRNYCLTHDRLLKLADRLSEDQLSWRPAPTAHSIAFHLWHIARWADHLQASIPGMTASLSRKLPASRQLWEAEALAARWGFDNAELGVAATGMTMSDDIAVTLPLPAKEILLDYARRAFAAADGAVQAIDEEEFAAAEQPQPLTADIWAEGSTVADAIFSHLGHENRHLGMIECLLGLQAGSGTATV